VGEVLVSQRSALPGKLRCQAEPALALTPPATPTKGEDSLLAGLDGALGSESLSGLTRAFFYPGARALPVSHWAVAPGTVDLTTGMFAAYTRKPGVGKAEALRCAQAAVRAEPGTAHPFFWAPFVHVGDGGATP
jgi:CHAT domain